MGVQCLFRFTALNGHLLETGKCSCTSEFRYKQKLLYYFKLTNFGIIGTSHIHYSFLHQEYKKKSIFGTDTVEAVLV
jgi:hypothetical protein